MALDKSNIDSRATALQREHQGPEYTPLGTNNGGKSPAQVNDQCCSEKVAVTRRISPQVAVMVVTYFAMYLSNEGVITGLSSSPFAPRAHVSYYLLSSKFGYFLGMSHLLLLSLSCPKVLPYVRVRKTWLLALLEVAILLFFGLESWFRFVPHVGIILVLCVLSGFLAGAVYVNAALDVADAFSEPRRKELGLGSLPRGNAVGELFGILTSLLVEPWLRRHCLNTLELDEECFAQLCGNATWFYNAHCTHLPQGKLTCLT